MRRAVRCCRGQASTPSAARLVLGYSILFYSILSYFNAKLSSSQVGQSSRTEQSLNPDYFYPRPLWDSSNETALFNQTRLNQLTIQPQLVEVAIYFILFCFILSQGACKYYMSRFSQILDLPPQKCLYCIHNLSNSGHILDPPPQTCLYDI